MIGYGLTQHTLEQIINILTKNPKVEEVVLFGSRAVGNYREGSDVDLALKGKGLEMDELLKLSAELDELDLPYYFDLLVFEKIDNNDLLDHICRVGQTIYKS
ncbi:MAG TPA: nucleotidyltransferase domain-containing protein [Syntrophomonas sp.]|nr:nucleotidyltransferase domain-containing protein [Syntrophomonas sp.]